jgi:hypothetical protein
MKLECQNCGAALTVEGALRTAVCAFCDAPSVVERPEGEAGARPTFTLGFVQPREAVEKNVARWLKSRSVFCPGSVRRAKMEALQGVYVPAYLYSAVARSEYTAQIGERYTVVETYHTTEDGKSVTRTRTRTETEWRSLAGRYTANVVDVLVTASAGLSNAELAAVEPFDYRAIRRYSPAMISGWLAEDPSMGHAQCLELARAEALQQTSQALERFLPGDGHRSLEHQTRLEQEELSLVQVPVWLLNARYRKDKPPIRIVVNGQTGAIFGKPPLSGLRITLTVLAALAALLGVWLWLNGGLP